jgi:integral membrane protein 2B
MPSAEKKSDNVPLVNNIEIDPSTQAKDLESGNVGSDQPVRSKFLVLRVINERVYSIWALIYVLMMSLLITFMILYGEYIYRSIGNIFNDEATDAFYGTGTIAVNGKLDFPSQQDINNDYDAAEFKKIESFALNMEKLNNPIFSPEDVISEFKEDFELDLKEDSYEKIMPNIPLTNSARFIHDFSANVTGIVDVVSKRCFVMPLNHSTVLPPTSLYDLLFKMSSGYYSVDTKNVMHNMRVVKPAIEDLTEYGIYIAKDCAGYPTYKLENIISRVSKRSVSNGKTFSAFSGKMDSFHIVNYHDIDLQ